MDKEKLLKRKKELIKDAKEKCFVCGKRAKDPVRVLNKQRCAECGAGSRNWIKYQESLPEKARSAIFKYCKNVEDSNE